MDQKEPIILMFESVGKFVQNNIRTGRNSPDFKILFDSYNITLAEIKMLQKINSYAFNLDKNFSKKAIFCKLLADFTVSLNQADNTFHNEPITDIYIRLMAMPFESAIIKGQELHEIASLNVKELQKYGFSNEILSIFHSIVVHNVSEYSFLKEYIYTGLQFYFSELLQRMNLLISQLDTAILSYNPTDYTLLDHYSIVRNVKDLNEITSQSRGTILNSKNDNPVSGALIDFDDYYSTVSDTVGKFNFNNIMIGNYLATVCGLGFYPQLSVPFTIRKEQIINNNIYLIPDGK